MRGLPKAASGCVDIAVCNGVLEFVHKGLHRLMATVSRAFILAVVVAMPLPGPSRAQTPTTAQLSDEVLQSESSASSSNLDDVHARLNALQYEVDALRANPRWPGLEEGRLRTTDVPRSEDAAQTPTFPKIKLSGFFHADAGYFHQGAASFTTFGDINDSAGFRRARLAAVGDVFDNVSYVLEMDFATPGRPSFMDVWLDVHDVRLLGNVRIGQWRQPFGMSALTSVRELMFLERSLSFAFVPFRQVGVGFHDANADETVTWAFSGFRFPTDTFGNAGSPATPLPADGTLGDEGYGLAGRVTARLWGDPDCGPLLHVGGDYAYLRPGTNAIEYRSPPEYGGPFVGPLGNQPSVPFFVDTGVVPTQNIHLYNFEVGGRLGSLYGQSELTYAVVETPLGYETLPGVYVQAAYLLTGEVRPYNAAGGVFGRVKPLANFGQATGWGAWELAVRYSYIDLNNAYTLGLPPPNAGAPAFGGRESNVTFGVNWYLNQYAKFQFNYIDARLNRNPVGRSDTGIFAARAQLDF
jgi:phosphate-selective porin OprO/OprP